MLEITQIPLSKLHPSARQPRKNFDQKSIEALADSIRIHGILQPLVVRTDGARYEIIAGERRFRASKLAKLQSVPAIILGVTDERALQLSIVENLQRENLNPIEVSRACQTLIDAFGLTQEQVGKQVGMSRPAVSNLLRLLSLPEELQLNLEQGILTEGHARAILGLKTSAAQIELSRKVISKGMSVRQTEKAVQAERSADPPAAPEVDPDLIELEDRLRRALGTKVSIRDHSGHGHILIEYYSHDDFERLLTLFERPSGRK